MNRIHSFIGHKKKTFVDFIDSPTLGGLVVGGVHQVQCPQPRLVLRTLMERLGAKDIAVLACVCFDCEFYQALCADEFRLALDSMEAGQILVILLDFMMVQIIDDALCRAVRALALQKGLAVLVISSQLTWPDEVDARIKLFSDGTWKETSLRPKLFGFSFCVERKRRVAIINYLLSE
jgi:hypothetical protein